MVHFDQLDTEVKNIGHAEQADGKLASQFLDDKLMHHILEGDKTTIDHAELIQEAQNRNIGAFTPDLLFSQLVNNYHVAKQLLGDKLIRLLSGYDPKYIEKNLNIPEFKKELKTHLAETVQTLKDDGLLDKEGIISQKGAELGALILIKELDHYITKDAVGEKTSKIINHYGEKTETKPYKKGDRYKDIHLKQSIHNAIKRQHTTIMAEDLMTANRRGKGTLSIILALDASASMKGQKIETCKRAGITLAYKAIQEKNEVGLVVFGSEIKQSIAPTKNFTHLLTHISTIKANKQTDLAGMIRKSIELFPIGNQTKHLIILTDALPTVGKQPEHDSLLAASLAKGAGITISIIGVQLDLAGIELAKKITHIGQGRFSLAKNLDHLGTLVLEDYQAVR